MAFNEIAYKERQVNSRFIKAFDGGDHALKVLEIDTTKVTYKGRKWADLDAYNKRKFENALFLQESYARVPLKFVYKH